MELPPLRRAKKRVDLSRIAGWFSEGVASINATVEPRAEFWDAWNKENLSAEGPLWLAFGDSVTQGIGSSTPSTSYVSLVLDRLRKRTGQKWRLVNLSMSGARFSDVVNLQIPAMEELRFRPDLITAIIGSNDIMWRRNTQEIARDAEKLMESLPEGTYLSRISRPNINARRSAISRTFETMASERCIELFAAWNWPTSEGMWAQDRFHPNDYAYEYIADNLWTGLHSTDFI
ncbi:MAG: GDSL-type esterase/lipase family protein [Acidimicrobiales bacterium]|jgi:lysophospholipase L1-like esterase|nr:GDSL-type esterase/lipase family protein [Acidimicrobiales bacterium]MDP6298237.1 GDSL-type esterase/lipase family protein [Acidimicrobiales bacterium]HJM29039.1 GDSL-type esterase/lipase family protein [Acidimicrobiales bacterium]HJM98382.1 GDSL-type esterase/lipase family protein [Acidimicrobiales bacterium]